MRKGATPIIECTLPSNFDIELVAKAKLTIEYKEGEVLEKYASAQECKGRTFRFTLTQEETFMFDGNSNIKMQLRVLTKEGETLSSNVRTVFVEECLDNEVLE